MISECNEAAQHREHSRGPISSSILFLSTFQNWQSGSATRLAKRPGLAMFYFGIRRSRESDHRLEAKIDRPPPIRGIDQAQFGYQEEEEVQGCGLTAKPTLNA
jgi:hypothetical protein